MILVAAVLAAVGVALLRRGSLRGLADLPIRLGWIAMLSFAAQAYVIYSPADRVEIERPFHAALLLGSYSTLFLMVWVNRRITGMSILGVGLVLNLAVIAANGGFMPVSQEAVLAAGTRPTHSLPAEGSRLPRSKDILLSRENTRLWILSDAIADSRLPFAKVYSLGDLFLAAGVFVLVQAAMVQQQDRPVYKRTGMKIA